MGDIIVDANLTDAKIVSPTETTDIDAKKSWTKTIVLVLIGIAVLAVVWWAYKGFTSNANDLEPMTAGLKQERDDLLADYNLRDAVKQLNQKQEKILKGISSATDV